jgi:replicative DNA helicase Mcm
MDELRAIATGDAESLYVEFSDLYRYEPDFADDLRTKPDRFIEHMEEAVGMVDLPSGDNLTDTTVRVTGLNEEHVYAPGQVRKDIAGEYVGIRGNLERVTTTSDQPEQIAFECQRCGTVTVIPQNRNTKELQEPHECQACERQGPFRELLNDDRSEWSDYAKLRIESRP